MTQPLLPTTLDAKQVYRAFHAIPGTRDEQAQRLGSSSRTISRWLCGDATPSAEQALEIIRLVHASGEAALAAELAEACKTSLAALGLEGNEPAAPRAHPLVAESVVCAAAEALDLSPRAIRGALLAAFERADVLGLSIQDVVAALGPPTQPRDPKASAKRARST